MSKRTNRRLSQSEKISKRLRGIKSGVGLDVKKAVHTVNVYAKRVPVTLNGFLVSHDVNGVVFRHKKTNASKKTRISTFQIRDVVKVFGRPGEPSSITILRSDLMYSMQGTIQRDPETGAIKVKDSVTGELTTLFPNDEVHIEIFADEDDKAQRRAKPSGKKGKKAAPVEDDEDEDDEDEEDFEDEDEDLEDEEDEDDDSDEDDEEDDDSDDEEDDEEDEDDEDEDDDEDDEDLDDEDL